MRTLGVAALVFSCVTAVHGAGAPGVKSIRLVLPPRSNATVGYIAGILSRQIEQRCDARITQDDAPLTVELTIEPGIGTEGYRIVDGGKNIVRIMGNDERGLLYGVGQFLHTSSYGSEGFTPGSWRGVAVPQMPVRGMYLATHFHNFYQDAPIEEVTRYIEELSLWGTNSFLVWFGIDEFNGIDDPKAQAMLDRLRALLKIVRDLGLDTSLGCVANDGYKNSPVELRADDSTVDHVGYHTRNGKRIYNLGPELCPSKPGVPELELKYCEEKFAAFKSVGLDYWFIWPYDNGGCTCAKCAPWGANGYLRLAEPAARAYRRAFPKGKVILSTWDFDLMSDGDWAGLAAKFNAKKPDWVDYLMVDITSDQFPQYPLEHGVPGGLPMLNFPEISMWGQGPWGGYGANPLPGRLQKRWDTIKRRLSGGFPYSEGIYEDINKVICTQFYWNADRPALDTIRQYIAFEFSPEVVDDVLSAVRILEENHLRDHVGASAVTAYELIMRADARLSPQARRSWRWRLLHVRALLDQEIYRNSRGEGRDEMFKQACDELTQMYHAEHAVEFLRPIRLRAKTASSPE